MGHTTLVRPNWAIAAGLLAVAFGIMTIVAGGMVLFGGPSVRETAGNVVPFVLWFNFVAGFAYVVAGVGLILWGRWAALLSAAIALLTIVVFAGLAIHGLLGGAFEGRTIGAMTFRSLFWIVIAIAASRGLGLLRRTERQI
jgi:hypothetical protein